MRILVVEDERKAAEYLQKGLSESGYQVEVALDGLDARHLIEEERFDLAVDQADPPPWRHAGTFPDGAR